MKSPLSLVFLGLLAPLHSGASAAAPGPSEAVPAPALQAAVSSRPSTAADKPPAVAAPGVEAAAVLAELLASHPEIAFWQARVAEMRAGLRGAGARPAPELSFGLGRKRVRDSAGLPAGEGQAWSVSVSQTFEWPGRGALRRAVADRDLALAELGLERLRTALAARGRTLLFALDAAVQKCEAVEEVAARCRDLSAVLQARENSGISPALEARVIEAEGLVLERRAAQARQAATALLVEFNQLRGLPADTPLRVQSPVPTFPALPEPAQLLEAARRNDFLLRSRQLELERQESESRLARHARKPSVTVSPYVEEERAGERERTLGLGLSMPLGSGGRAQAEWEAAQAREQQARAALQAALRDNERETLLAAQAYASLADAAASWPEEVVAGYRESAALADRHYRLGAVPVGTYLEMQKAYLEALEAVCDTRLEALEAAEKLRLLTGLELQPAQQGGAK